MIGDEPANTDYDPGPSVEAHTARRRYVTCRVSSHDTSIGRPTIVGLVVKPIGKPSAGNRHARFDERGWETERWPWAPSYRAHPRLYLLGHAEPLIGLPVIGVMPTARRPGCAFADPETGPQPTVPGVRGGWGKGRRRPAKSGARPSRANGRGHRSYATMPVSARHGPADARG